MTVTASTTVAELATVAPATIAVFQRHNIDFCCGGKRPLLDVCAERGLVCDALIAELNAATAAPAPARLTWDQRPLAELTAHIVESFHDPLREELPRLIAMARRVDERHGMNSQPNAAQMARELEMFLAAITPHTREEEEHVFPLIEALERGEADANAAAQFDASQSALETEHQEAGRTLDTLRRLSNNYQAPEGSCPTTRGLYYGLGELEALMTLHVHLENNVLFPRASALARTIREGARS